jgi:hypothetical protein
VCRRATVVVAASIGKQVFSCGLLVFFFIFPIGAPTTSNPETCSARSAVV